LGEKKTQTSVLSEAAFKNLFFILYTNANTIIFIDEDTRAERIGCVIKSNSVENMFIMPQKWRVLALFSENLNNHTNLLYSEQRYCISVVFI